jgi:hypothetical protein
MLGSCGFPFRFPKTRKGSYSRLLKKPIISLKMQYGNDLAY